MLAQRWLAAHDEHAPDLRFDVVGVLVRPRRGRRWSPTCGRRSRDAGPHLVGGAGRRARRDGRGRGRHGRRACRRWCSSGCRTRWCASRSTGSARRWSTPARSFPQRRITIGLSPASMPKQGSGFDLALAVARPRGGRRGARRSRSSALVLLGELGLDGSVRGIRGVLPAVLAAARAGHAQVVVPAANADEAALVERRRGAGRRHAGRGARPPRRARARCPGTSVAPLPEPPPAPDLADVVGQASGRRAVEVAAAGGSPPVPGRTARARARRCSPSGCPGCCPSLDEQAALEVTAIHSVAGHAAAGGAADRPVRPSRRRTTRRRWRR